MGGRGGSGKNPYGSPDKLYMFTIDTYRDGVKMGSGEILSNGGSMPSWFTKEVGEGAIPSINWYFHAKGAIFTFHEGEYVYMIKSSKLSYSTTNSLNDYNLEQRIVSVKDYPNPNNHPIVILD